MNVKKVKRGALLTTAAAAAVYSLVSGKGPFNKVRFKEQHEELARYVDNNYPGFSYSAITKHGNGWTASVKSMGRPIVFLYFSKSPNGVYVFTESREKLN